MLGLEPTLLSDATIARSIEIALLHRDRIDVCAIDAQVRWRDRELTAVEQAAR